MTPKFQAIAEEAADNLKRLMIEINEKIEEAISKAVEEAQLQEAPAKFALGFKVTLSLDENKITHALSWSNKTTLTVETEIPDPEQGKLKLEEE